MSPHNFATTHTTKRNQDRFSCPPKSDLRLYVFGKKTLWPRVYVWMCVYALHIPRSLHHTPPRPTVFGNNIFGNFQISHKSCSFSWKRSLSLKHCRLHGRASVKPREGLYEGTWSLIQYPSQGDDDDGNDAAKEVLPFEVAPALALARLDDQHREIVTSRETSSRVGAEQRSLGKR